MSDILAREKPTVDSGSNSPSTDATPPQSPSQGSSHSSGLQIPEPTDGYFGYSEEKSLRHVRR
jgi:AMP deaminase